MKPLFFIFILVLAPIHSAFSGIGDELAKVIFQKKIDNVYSQAQKCSPLERDSKSSLSVEDWIKRRPALPAWQLMARIEEVSKDARAYAKSVGGKDKRLHCLAGCFVARELDYDSAVLVGWFKELLDASDCSVRTSFEKKDFDATVEGAKRSLSSSSLECHDICKK